MGISEKIQKLKEKFDFTRKNDPKNPKQTNNPEKSTLSVSNVPGTSAPPLFEDTKKNSDINLTLKNLNSKLENRTNSLLINSIKNTLSTSSSNSSLNFPERSSLSYSTNDHSDILVQNARKMKEEDNRLIYSSMTNFDFRGSTLALSSEDSPSYIAHSNYLINEKNKSALQLSNHPKDKKSKDSKLKPTNLYIETIDSLFDQDGKVHSRHGTVRYVGSTGFSTNHLRKNNEKKVLKIDKEEDNATEEELLLAEIIKFDKQFAENNKQNKYYFKGKQFYPPLNETSETNKEHKEDDRKLQSDLYEKIVQQINKPSNDTSETTKELKKDVQKSKPDIVVDQSIVQQIMKDFLLLHGYKVVDNKKKT